MFFALFFTPLRYRHLCSKQKEKNAAKKEGAEEVQITSTTPPSHQLQISSIFNTFQQRKQQAEHQFQIGATARLVLDERRDDWSNLQLCNKH